MNQFILALATLLVASVMPAMADMGSENSKLSFAIVGDFAKTKNDIRIKDKTLTFQTGSIGLQGTLSSDQYGEFFVKYGLGQSPSESATFAGAVVSGSIDLSSYGVGYVYPYDIANTAWSIDFKIDKTVNKHKGDSFTGFRYDKPVTASIDGSSSFTRGSIGLNYQINKEIELTAGIGSYDWNISAEAKGLFVNSPGVRFSTDTEANGTDQFHYLEAIFPMMDRVMSLGIRRSNLNTDTQNTLREIYIKIAL